MLLVIMLCGTLGLLIYPKTTRAQWLVYDGAHHATNIKGWLSMIPNTTSNVTKTMKDMGFDAIGYIIAKTILSRITAQTVNWINSGFEGNPAFVADPQRFFVNMADQTASQFFIGANSPLNQLCSPFRAEVRLALVKNYLLDRDPNQYQCTFERIGANFQNFTRDFSQGGWAAWFTMTQQYQNNPYGAYIEGQKSLSLQIQTQRGIKEKQLNEGRGFLSYERCRRDYVPSKKAPRCIKTAPLVVGGGEPACLEFEKADANGEVLQCPAEEREVVTPGSVINEQLGRSLGSSYAQLEAADEINEVVNALMIQLIQKTFSSVQGGLRGLSQTRNNTPSPLQQLQNTVDIPDSELGLESTVTASQTLGATEQSIEDLLRETTTLPLTETEIQASIDRQTQVFVDKFQNPNNPDDTTQP